MNFTDPWYHGSPLQLNRLRKGSTITQDRDLARVFSHRPPLVSETHDASGSRLIKHTGESAGCLYQVIDGVSSADVFAHPKTAMEPGQEWLTRRELPLEFIERTVVRDHERLSAEEIAALRQRLEGQSDAQSIKDDETG